MILIQYFINYVVSLNRQNEEMSVNRISFLLLKKKVKEGFAGNKRNMKEIKKIEETD